MVYSGHVLRPFTGRFALIAMGVFIFNFQGVLADDDESALELSPVVVITSKSPRPIQEVAGTVHILDAAASRRHLAQNPDQLLRYQPSVNTDRAGTRFGSSGINIRGIGENRVAIEVDGVPQRDQFDIGSFANGGRNLFDTGLIKRIEILNGPASTLYGSDAIGGVMAITTWDPDELAADSGRPWSMDLSTGYHGEDQSRSVSLQASWWQDGVGALAAVTRRRGHELDNQSASGLPDDQQNWDSRNGLARLVLGQDNGNRLRITASEYRRHAQSQIYSILGLGRFRSTTALAGDDRDQQKALSLSYDFGPLAGFDRGTALVYRQNSDTVQRTREQRAAARRPVRLQRDFYYQQDISGAELNLFRDFGWGSLEHSLALGLAYSGARSEELRDALQFSLLDDSVTNRVLGETFPLRDFPISRSTEWGLFIHDEITNKGERWTLIPGLRLDHYRLRPHGDGVYLEDHPQAEIVALSDQAVSPKLGLVYQFNSAWSGFAQYARGFRAPPFEDANIGLDIPLFNIRAISNPELKAETSDGLELGIRKWSRQGDFSLAAFYTRYDDFIETKARIGVDPASGVLLFQSRNVDQARIYGAEISWSQQLGAWRSGLQGLRFELEAFWARGDNRVSGQPLNSITPPQAVAGLHWQAPSGRFNTGLVATFTRSKSRIDSSAGKRFEVPGYGVLDWYLGWQLNRQISLRGGIFNLGDRKYWRWQDVQAFSPDDPVVEVLSRPGRHFGISFDVKL